MVPQDNRNWNLLRIINVVFSPGVSDVMTVSLRQRIKEHHQLFLNVCTPINMQNLNTISWSKTQAFQKMLVGQTDIQWTLDPVSTVCQFDSLTFHHKEYGPMCFILKTKMVVKNCDHLKFLCIQIYIRLELFPLNTKLG